VNSFDGQSTVKELCEDAITKSISIITITDHMEVPEISLGAKSQYGNMMEQIANSVADVEECQSVYKDNLTLLKGIELGEPMHNPKMAEKALQIADFDFVLASVHNLKDEEDFYFIDYSSVDVNKLLARYFDELLDTAQNADFDSLAHLTYPLRYIAERTNISVNLNQFSDVIDNIFKALIDREKALEVNTSGLFKKIKATLPDINLVKRFKELGGKYVTIGSDAHNAMDLAKGIEQGIELVRTCGFEHYTIFENRQPRMIEIWY
jgi:histidinol-phosphatase (PHP family)